MATYEAALSIEQLNAKKVLRVITLDESGDFTVHIILLWNKLSYVGSVGAKISKKNFIAIILNSLPPSWDLVIVNVFEYKLLSVVIANLQAWWMRKYKNNPNKPGIVITALQISNYMQWNYSQLICTNLKCNQQGYTIDICYWSRGEKEGQFPPNFGKRGGARESVAYTHQGDYKLKAIANVAKNPNNDNNTYAFITMNNIHLITNGHLLICCYESPKKEKVSHAFEHLIQNLKAYNGVRT